MTKELNFLASILNSGLNLLVVLVLGRLVPVADYAAFGAGIIYGGLLVVFVAFGNDTLLARGYLREPISASVAAMSRAAIIVLFALGLAPLFPLATVVGGVFLASTAMQQRFYFEARELQGAFNAIGLVEKIVMLALLYVLVGDQADANAAFWGLLAVRVGGGALVSVWVVAREGVPSHASGCLSALREQIGHGTAFTLQFALMQIPAIALTRLEPAGALAAYTATSQIGAGLLAIVTQFQRPRIFRYLSGRAAIRNEVILSLAVTIGALMLVAAARPLITGIFPLIDWVLLAVFGLQAVVFSLIHPFELRAFSSGGVPAWSLIVGALVAGSVTLLLALQVGFPAIPVGATLCQMLVFALCRMWRPPPASASLMR